MGLGQYRDGTLQSWAGDLQPAISSRRGLRVALATYVLVTFGWRTWLQWRRTGDTGLRLSSSTGWAARTASALIVGGTIGGFAVVFRPGGRRTRSKLTAACGGAGVAVVLGATVLTARAQLDLGESWRVGVDRSEVTPLVTDGMFSSVRNPIFSGMAMAGIGVLIAEPTPASLLAALSLLAGIQLQVRGVEEPHLRDVHGDAFDAYVRGTGRFLPRQRA